MKMNTKIKVETYAIYILIFGVAGIPLYFIMRDFLSLPSSPVMTASIMSLAILLSFLLMKIVKNKNHIFRFKLAFWLLIFSSMYYILRWLLAVQIFPIDKFMLLYALLNFWFPFFILNYISSETQTDTFVKAFTAISFLLAILSYYQYFSGALSHLNRYQISEGFNYKSQAILLGFGVIYSFIHFLKEKKVYMFLFFVLLFIPFFLSGSRSALFGLGLSIILYYVFFMKKSFIQTFLFLGLIIGAFILIFKYMPESILKLFFTKEMYMESTVGIGVGGRADVIYMFINEWFTTPINFFFGLGSEINTKHYYAHNIWAQLLGETGLIGFLFFFCTLLLIVLKFIKSFLKKRQKDLNHIILFLFFIYSLTTLQFGGHFMTVGYFWLIVGMMYSLIAMKKSKI